MWLEFPPLLSHLSQNPSCRAIILSGAGDRAFTTGLDLTSAASNNLFTPTAHKDSHEPEPWETNTVTPSSHNEKENNSTAYPRPHPTSQTPAPPPPSDPARIAHSLRSHILDFQSSVSSLANCPKPVIAALHGHCLGLGIDIACCADIRLCTPETIFSVKEVDIGLAADVGTLTRLGKIVGSESWVKELCLTARPFGAQEAETRGFISKVVSTSSPTTTDRLHSSRTSSSSNSNKIGDPFKPALLAAAISLASSIASKSPVAVQGTKEIMNYSREHGTEDGLRYTAAWNMGMLQTGDLQEAMVAGMKKRRGRFAKL